MAEWRVGPQSGGPFFLVCISTNPPKRILRLKIQKPFAATHHGLLPCFLQEIERFVGHAFPTLTHPLVHTKGSPENNKQNPIQPPGLDSNLQGLRERTLEDMREPGLRGAAKVVSPAPRNPTEASQCLPPPIWAETRKVPRKAFSAKCASSSLHHFGALQRCLDVLQPRRDSAEGLGSFGSAPKELQGLGNQGSSGKRGDRVHLALIPDAEGFTVETTGGCSNH